MSLDNSYNAIEDQRSESFVEQALSQVSFMDLEDVEEFGRPVSVHDARADTDVSRPTEPGFMRRGSELDSEGEEDDDEGEVIVRSIQLDMSELSHTTMEPIQEELVTSADVERGMSHPDFTASGSEDRRRFDLPKAASHSGVGTQSSVQKFIQMLSWKRRMKSDTTTTGELPTLAEEGPKPEQSKRSEKRGLFGRRQRQDRGRQADAPPAALPAVPNVHLTGGETAPTMTPKVFQSYFRNALEGKVDNPVPTEDNNVDCSAYIM
ncbi:uncharacterized protein [Argopecten irradians]|uniref:uncharacterized protein n=1 Tax=Argopecten irradians TaxID=31199 RepID=UPI00371CDEDF